MTLMIWMFATSVVYPVHLVEGQLGQLLRLNPMTPLIDGYRAVLLRGEIPPLGPLAVTAVLSLVILFTGWVIFHRAEYRFAEYA
jgi:ABC-type polysaccharide/polyol phosphate export permease